MLRPQPSTQGTRSPSPLPRRPSPPHGPQIQGSPSHSLLLLVAFWTLMLKKRHPVRRLCGQKVNVLYRFFIILVICLFFFFFFLAFLFKLLERSAAAVAGYQHPCESASGHASQFYIALLDANNKEQRLDERGTTPLSTELIFFSFILFIAILG